MRKPCCDKEGTNKGACSKQEDQNLIDYIRTHGDGGWRSLPKASGLDRCGKSCKRKWINYLRSDTKRCNFAQDEEDLIIKLHALLGNRWSLIAGRLPGKTDNEVKNYWNSHLRKKLINMGIDPNNHKVNQIPHPGAQHAATIVTSILVDEACKRKVHSGCNDRVSDAGSGLEDVASATGSSSLNLDLNIAAPSSSLTQIDEEKPPKKESMMVSEFESDEIPTLLFLDEKINPDLGVQRFLGSRVIAGIRQMDFGNTESK